ncbi:MAG: [protein-PII] uridylyltransferase [Burkholderiales bacterium]|nr:[protein-PII] uridylyltransferase [Burkholderiales bacterium]
MAPPPSVAASRTAPQGSLRQRLAGGRAALFARFAAGGNASSLLSRHCRLVDTTLADMWRETGLGNAATLVAVGGYGRGELYPHSDVDVLLLLPDNASAATKARLEALVGQFWDVGIEAGHSIRTLDECFALAGRDVTVQTTLIEARYLAGDRRLFRDLEAGTRHHLDPRAFYTAKRLELEQRHTKHQDTPYSLEPNCKESPGGLRDLQVILWIARAAGLGTRWRELAARGVITRSEAAMLAKRERLLKTIRVRLHLLARRREDRLLFDHQTELAHAFGFKATATRRASEQLMQRYYINCRWIIQLNTILMQNIAAQLFPGAAFEARPLNERFHVERDLLAASDPAVFETHPSALLECFRLLQEHADLKGMTAPTLRALWRSRNNMDAAFRRDAANQATFLAILQSPRGLVHELRRMNQWGILGRYIPAFKRIIGQMQHDLFHVYTVDQHILMVVRNVRRFTMLEFAHEYPLCSRLIANFERHWLIYIAALFHDIAKGRGGDHSQLGKLDARAFCRAHRLTREDTGLVEFLVEHHLTMSSVAQKQDLGDPQTIRRFAQVVGNERRLIALYLLTVADIRGTSPKVWNAWKGKLLEDLFRATRRVLSASPADGRAGLDADLQEKQAEALRTLKLYGFSERAHEALWRELDVAYFMRHDAREIAWQTRTLVARMESPDPVVKARHSPIGEGMEVMVWMRDRADLFARICGYFDRAGLSIVEAKVHTTRNGYALDSFVVMEASGDPGGEHGRAEQIEREMPAALTSVAPLRPPGTARLSRLSRHFAIEPAVNLRPDERGQRHILAVTAGDRPGLLYRIALVLGRHGVNLQTAKITTLGERAEDVFLIDGGELASARAVLALETDLLETLRQ